MTVRVRATLADGRVVVGPVRGSGGMLGADAAERLARMQRRADLGRPLRGHGMTVAMYPEHGPHGDGPAVVVPVLGTRFEVEG